MRQEISRIDSSIEDFNQTIGELLKKRNDSCIRLMGLETKIASAQDDDSEIMDYFIRNANLVLEYVNDTSMVFCTKGYLEYFDSEDGGAGDSE